MIVEENYSLKKAHTFGIDVYCRYFAELFSSREIAELLRSDLGKLPRLILGGGSNILFRDDFDGLVLKNNILGIVIEKEDAEHCYIRAGAGVNWHSLVMFCVERGYGGIENLSLIPGNVGAAPMQNIGAYGAELKDVFHELEALNLENFGIEKFDSARCRFGYRESIFKQEARDRYAIVSVTLRLSKKPVFNTSYGAIEKELEAMGVKELSIKAISQAVINIRRSKLPDPAEIGNAGSFFKNPVVSAEKHNALKQQFPELVSYKNSDTGFKLAAGWLIEQAGWKGKTFGQAGVHKNQALVLVNYGGAKGQEIWNLSEKVLQSVKEKFGVLLEREVNIV